MVILINEFKTFRDFTKSFNRYIQNYRNYLIKILKDGTIQEGTELYDALKLQLIIITNLDNQNGFIDFLVN